MEFHELSFGQAFSFQPKGVRYVKHSATTYAEHGGDRRTHTVYDTHMQVYPAVLDVNYWRRDGN